MVSLLLAIIYLAFISLGLPDSLLGAAWPSIYPEMGVPMSYSGIIFMIIALGTVISSLFSDRLTRRLGAGVVTALSVFLTAAALFGFSLSHSFLALCLWAVPYGIGAGSVDAALNNYVALHYASKHMSWLHCMWGVGTIIGPYLMSAAMTTGVWNDGYRNISVLQIILTAILVLSLPLWRIVRKTAHKPEAAAAGSTQPVPEKALSLREIVMLPGAKSAMFCFFLYSGVEQTVSLWASSFLVTEKGIDPVTAARFASLFFIGITVGRGISGFATLKFSDANMIRIGEVLIGIGICLCLLPLPTMLTLAGIVVIGFGCAPVYPSIIHATPAHFGAGAFSGCDRRADGGGIYRYAFAAALVRLGCQTISGLAFFRSILVSCLRQWWVLHEMLCQRTKAAHTALV